MISSLLFQRTLFPLTVINRLQAFRLEGTVFSYAQVTTAKRALSVASVTSGLGLCVTIWFLLRCSGASVPRFKAGTPCAPLLRILTTWILADCHRYLRNILILQPLLPRAGFMRGNLVWCAYSLIHCCGMESLAQRSDYCVCHCPHTVVPAISCLWFVLLDAVLFGDLSGYQANYDTCTCEDSTCQVTKLVYAKFLYYFIPPYLYVNPCIYYTVQPRHTIACLYFCLSSPVRAYTE
jgi:hypothetical protein